MRCREGEHDSPSHLYWSHRNGRWNRYTEATPTADVTVLLNEIEEDPTGIFWG